MQGHRLIQEISRQSFGATLDDDQSRLLWEDCADRMREAGLVSSVKSIHGSRPDRVDPMAMQDLKATLAQLIAGSSWPEGVIVAGSEFFRQARLMLLERGASLDPVSPYVVDRTRALGL